MSALIPHLCEEGLIDLQSKIADESQSIIERTECLLALLVKGGPKNCTKFLEALQKEDQHMGHKYILALLSGHEYADEDEVTNSLRIRKHIGETAIREVLLKGMKLETALIDHLFNEMLVTEDEFEMLLNCDTQTERNEMVLKILNTKGPTAHLKFAQCLHKESTHVTHHDLFKLICNDETLELHILSMNRKRKSREDDEVSVTKRVPIRLEIEGELVTEEYLKVIHDIRFHHNQGEWDAVDKIVEDCAVKNVEFYVAVMLESCTGFITCKRSDKVEETVKRARELCSQITNNCNTFLRGRCEWTLAKLYRYTKEDDKALEHIIMARHIQFNIKAGEDTALCNYCYACILLESLAVKFDSYKDKEAKRSLELAIEHASSGDYGLDVAHPKIRLAQLYLGSSPQSPGTKTDHDSLMKAQSSLDSVAQDLETLAVRTQCIYYYTESDLYRNSGEQDRAKHSAQKALDIAEVNKFNTEIELVKKRLNFLSISD